MARKQPSAESRPPSNLFAWDDKQILEFRDVCLHEITKRQTYYNELRRVLLDNIHHNLVAKTIKDIVSLIYLPDNVIFDLVIDPHLKGTMTDQKTSLFDLLQDVLAEKFIGDALDIDFYNWIFWGLIYGSYFTKTIIDGTKIKIKGVSPYDVGVYYEDNCSLDENQIFCHIARVPLHVAQSKYPGVSLPTVPPVRRQDGFVDLVISQNLPEAYSVMPIWERPEVQHQAKSIGEYAEIYELWLYDYDRSDWVMAQVVGDRVIKSVNPFLPGHHPFTMFVPNPIEGYIWGMSELHYLLKIQEILNREVEKIQLIEDLLAHPPMVVYGIQGSVESNEIQEKLRTPGSVIPIYDPTSKFDFYLPKLDASLVYNAIKFYQDCFRDQSGISGVLAGKPLPNVRAASYANILAMFASTQLKEKALRVEYFLEDVMGLVALGIVLTQKQFSAISNLRFRVDVFAHTSSPITSLAYQEMLLRLAEMGIIPSDVVINVLPIPKKVRVERQAKVIELLKLAQAAESAEKEPKRAK